MVEFLNGKKAVDERIIKTNLEKEFFFIDYSYLINNGDALRVQKQIDIDLNKKKGYDALTSVDLEKILMIPGADIGYKNYIQKIQQGLALCFISECYEPFRIFDKEADQIEFSKKQEQSKILDSDLKEFLLSKNMINRRHFLDSFGIVQCSNDRGQIFKRDKSGKFISSKKGNKSFLLVDDVTVSLFSLKSLNYALDGILKQRDEEKKTNQAIKKNQSNSLN